jgi:glycerophosphoryl diester phosphodiesterase
VPTPASKRFVVAHRAGNDLGVLRSAEALGVDFVEADVRLFWNRLEVRHAKTVGPLPILWDRWRLENPLAARFRLDQLLGALAPQTRLLLDLKGHDRRLPGAVLGALGRHPDVRPPTVCARSWQLLEPFRRRGYRTVYSVGSAAQLRALGRLGAGRVDGVSVHRRLLDADVVRELGRRAGVVLTWPVNTVDHARALLDWGVQGLITDTNDVAGWMVDRRTAVAA